MHAWSRAVTAKCRNAGGTFRKVTAPRTKIDYTILLILSTIGRILADVNKIRPAVLSTAAVALRAFSNHLFSHLR